MLGAVGISFDGLSTFHRVCTILRHIAVEIWQDDHEGYSGLDIFVDVLHLYDFV